MLNRGTQATLKIIQLSQTSCFCTVQRLFSNCFLKKYWITTMSTIITIIVTTPNPMQNKYLNSPVTCESPKGWKTSIKSPIKRLIEIINFHLLVCKGYGCFKYSLIIVVFFYKNNENLPNPAHEDLFLPTKNSPIRISLSGNISFIIFNGVSLSPNWKRDLI